MNLMRFSTVHRTWLGLALSATLFVPMTARADWQFLGTRRIGMAGAGLALPFNANDESANPALYAYLHSSFAPLMPSFGFFSNNISLSDFSKLVGSVSSGGVSTSKLASFAQTFGNNDKQLGVNGSLGFSFDGFVISGAGSADVKTVPNAALQSDVQNKVLLANFNPGDALDGYGYGYYSYEVAYGRFLNPKPTVTTQPRIAVGLRIKQLKSYFDHAYVNGGQIAAGSTSATQAPEMNGNTVLSKSGLGADLGFEAQFGQDLYGAVQVRNLIKPPVGYAATLPQDLTTGRIGETTVNPFATMVDMGVGTLLSKNIYGAVDLVDATNAGNSQELRAGATFNFAKNFAVQGGYSSRFGFAVGFTVYGFSIAYSQVVPLSISTAFRF